jgi:hypothetical protein
VTVFQSAADKTIKATATQTSDGGWIVSIFIGAMGGSHVTLSSSASAADYLRQYGFGDISINAMLGE